MATAASPGGRELGKILEDQPRQPIKHRTVVLGLSAVDRTNRLLFSCSFTWELFRQVAETACVGYSPTSASAASTSPCSK